MRSFLVTYIKHKYLQHLFCELVSAVTESSHDPFLLQEVFIQCNFSCIHSRRSVREIRRWSGGRGSDHVRWWRLEHRRSWRGSRTIAKDDQRNRHQFFDPFVLNWFCCGCRWFSNGWFFGGASCTRKDYWNSFVESPRRSQFESTQFGPRAFFWQNTQSQRASHKAIPASTSGLTSGTNLEEEYQY